MGKNKLNAKSAKEAAKKQIENTQVLEEQENVSEQYSSQHQHQLYDPDDTSTSAYLWLLVFSFLMFTFPFLTFYGVRSWLDEAFEFTTFQTNCFSVLASVLVVNFIICLYVYKAFRESTKPQQPSALEGNQESKKSN